MQAKRAEEVKRAEEAKRAALEAQKRAANEAAAREASEASKRLDAVANLGALNAQSSGPEVNKPAGAGIPHK